MPIPRAGDLLRFNTVGREEGERDGQVDLPDAIFLASAELYHCRSHDLRRHHRATDDLARWRSPVGLVIDQIRRELSLPCPQ